MPKVLEATAVIAAKDKTGDTFSRIAGKLRGLEGAMRGVSGASGKMAAATPAIVKLDKSIKGLAGAAVGTMIGHRVAHMVRAVASTYQTFDDLVRYQRAILGISEDQQKPFIQQAIHGGATSRYNDLQFLQAQLDLAQRGVDKNFIVPIVDMAKDYAQAMNAELPEAAKTIEGILFSTRKHIEDGNEALKAAQRAVDFSVKLAKIGGLDNEDVKEAFKYAGLPGSMAGLSDESVGAMLALMRRANIRGDEGGVAIRAIAGRLVAPTSKGLAALSSLGINYSDYVRHAGALSEGGFASFMRSQFGADLSGQMAARMAGILGDPNAIGNRDEFMTQGVEALAGLFSDKHGKLGVRDRKRLAKALGDFWKYSAESVDSETLLRAIIAAKPTLPILNALFGEKQGARAAAALAPQFQDYYDKLKAAPEGFARQIGEERMAGFAGAMKRLEGAILNVETALGRTWDNELTGAANAAAKLMQSFVDADQGTQKFVSGVIGATAALVAFEAALKAGSMLGILPGGLAGATTGAIARIAPYVGIPLLAGYGFSKLLDYTNSLAPPLASGFFDNTEIGARAKTAADLAWRIRSASSPDEIEGLRRAQEANQARLDMIAAGRFDGGGGPLQGSADITTKITVEPSSEFLTRIETLIDNSINKVRINGIPASGSAGSTGKAMPEAGPPQ